MSSSNKIARLLNIQQHEWPLVKLLFVLQFLQGASIALFFTSALSQFLDRFPISDLAYVFLLSSALLWITGIVCNKLEHKYSLYKLSIIMTVLMVSIIFFFWAGKFVFTSYWYFYLMLALFNVMYLVNNLEFWGLSAQVYDVRQSKRLFGVISSGDIPAKFFGYTIAILFVPFLGTQNLLIISLSAMLISIYVLKIIFNSPELQKITSHTSKIKQQHTAGITALVKLFTDNKLIIRTALLSMIAFTGFVLIEYAFYAEIKESHKYKTDESFARFTALFLGGARLIAWLFKLGFTGRIITKIGNRNALLITPIVLFVFNTILLLIFNVSPGSSAILYVFGAAAILVDALRASINSPVLLTILQPLSTPERLRSHNIVKGVMDPFAYLITGLLLLFLYRWGFYNLAVLCSILIGISLLWALYVFLVQKEYLNMLIKTISSRYFKNEDFNLYNKDTIEKITNKINTGNELEVLYILKLLENGSNKINNELIAKALNHPSEAVRIQALHLIDKKHIVTAADDLIKLVEIKTNPTILAKAIKVLSSIAYDYNRLRLFLTNENSQIRFAASESIIEYSKSENEKEPVIQSIKEMFSSLDPEIKLSAIKLASNISEPLFNTELIRLLKDPDEIIIKNTISTIGKKNNKTILSHLIPLFPLYEKEVLEAFYNTGDKALDSIIDMLQMKTINHKQKERLILTLGRIGSPASQIKLLELLPHLLPLNNIIIKSLNRSSYHITETSRPVIDSITNNYLIRSVELLFMLNRLQPIQKIKQTLYNSLLLELEDLRETLLNLFSFYSQKEQVDKIKKALQLNKKETAANALELIEATIKKDHASTFNTVFEDSDIAFRCNLLKRLIPEHVFNNIEKVVTRLLKEDEQFNNWTIACSLHSCKLIPLHLDHLIINRFLKSENKLLKETATFALS
jgi:ATP:ADP antiporter, AAA family